MATNVERLTKIIGQTAKGTVAIVWNCRTKQISIVYTDREGGKLGVYGGQADTFELAEQLTRKALGA